ncbi:MAG: GIY-YIG nuclease family protein [Parvibaculum sp.]|nr:GIY-YIG nuclease family protein [Parvibaculum sp.]
MEKDKKRQIVRDYKEKKVTPGIFAVRCIVTNERWLGPSRNLDAQQNGIWFQLGMGNHRIKDMQAAWNTHGQENMVYEVIERFEEEDMTPYLVQSKLKERLAHWRAELNAGLAMG